MPQRQDKRTRTSLNDRLLDSPGLNDRLYNPSQSNWDQKVDLENRTPIPRPEINDLQQSPKEDSSQQFKKSLAQQEEAASDKALLKKQQNAKQLENNPSNLYRPKQKPKGISGVAKGKIPSRVKRWAIATTISALISIIGIFGSLVSGAFVSLKEMALDFFSKNHYSAYSKRTPKLQQRAFREPKACKGIRCRFSSGISDAEIDKYKKAGLQVEVGENAHGKYLKSATIPDVDGAGKSITITADNFNEMYGKYPKIKGIAWSISSPKALVFRAKFALKKFTEFNISRSKLFKTAKKFREYFFNRTKKSNKNALSNADEGEDPDKKRDSINKEIGEANEGIVEAAEEESNHMRNNNFEEPSRIRPRLDGLNGDIETTGRAVGVNALQGSAKGSIKGAILGITDIIDKACTGYQLIRTLTIGAKIYKYAAFIGFAMTFIVHADAIKAGAAPAESVSFMAGQLTKPSTEEESLGKTAANSNLYSLIVGGGKIQDTTALGFGVMGTAALTFLIGAKKLFESFGANATSCKHVSKWYGQIALGVVGIATSILSGGTATVGGVVLGMAMGGAIAIITQLVTPFLIQFIAGTIIPDPEDPGGGYRVGETIASGLGAFSGEIGKGGLRPLKTEEAATVAKETNAEMALINEVERMGKSPLDPSVPNSVTNKLALAILPYVIAPASNANFQSLASLITSPLTLIGNSLNQLFYSRVNAQSTSYGGQYCADEEMLAAGILTDAYCNPVYGETNLDDPNYTPEKVVDYMINNKHVDEEIGNPLSDAYKKFRASCVDGSVPITADGAPIDVADDSTDTKLCLKTDEQTTMFRRFIMDTNILDGMDASANNTLGT